MALNHAIFSGRSSTISVFPRERPIFAKMGIERGDSLVVPTAGAFWSHPNLTFLFSVRPQLFDRACARIRAAFALRSK